MKKKRNYDTSRSTGPPTKMAEQLAQLHKKLSGVTEKLTKKHEVNKKEKNSAASLRLHSQNTINKRMTVERKCEELGISISDQGKVIAQVLDEVIDQPYVQQLSTRAHMEPLYNRAKLSDPNISLNTVYSMVKRFQKAGILRKPTKKTNKRFSTSYSPTLKEKVGILLSDKEIQFSSGGNNEQEKTEFYHKLSDQIKTIKLTGRCTVSEGQVVSDRLLINKRLTIAKNSGLGFQGDELEAVLGFDFGTTSSKIAVTLPYEVNSPTFIIDAPVSIQNEGKEYLWANCFWKQSNDEFSLIPASSAVEYENIKSKFILSHPNENDLQIVVTAYFATIIRYVKGFLIEKFPQFFYRKTNWEYNFGFPAASLNEGYLQKRFNKVCSAAAYLVDENLEIKEDVVKDILIKFSQDNHASFVASKIFPEIAAAVSGYSNSINLEQGLFFIVDVGGSTVDCCLFKLLSDPEYGKKCFIYVADVQSLGSEVFKVMKGEKKFFSKYLSVQMSSVIWKGKSQFAVTDSCWNEGRGLPYFFIGGGKYGELYQKTVSELDSWGKKKGKFSGCYEKTLPSGNNFVFSGNSALSEQDYDRLLVAYGLSFSGEDIPSVDLPHTIPKLDPLAISEKYASKYYEQT